MKFDEKNNCWVCGSKSFDMVKPANIQEEVTSDAFVISDRNYGITSNIYQCRTCKFMQCHDFQNVLQYYEKMEDEVFDEMWNERNLQQRKLLEYVSKSKASGKLLDIGAGNGMLVNQALRMGYEAIGIEPSKWLKSRAVKRGLPVYQGSFPNHDFQGPYDVVTLVDMLEHVTNPIAILRSVRSVMKKDGLGMLVTPDAGSFFARLFKFKWWHFRVAHIGYFNKKNLFLALERAGLKVVKIKRPGWYFNLDYLLQRLNHYLPSALNFPTFNFMKRIVLPFNVYDSLLVLFERSENGI